MADDYGAMTGLMSGVKEGLIAYQTSKNQQQQQKMFNLLNGVQQDQQGNVAFTPEKQSQIAQENMLKQKQTQAGLDEYDPNSQTSQNIRGFAQGRGLIGQDNTMSARDIRENAPLFSKALSADAASEKADNSNDLRAEQIKLAQQNRRDAQDQKMSDAHRRSLESTTQLLESARGNPAVAQAEKDLYAASKAKSLANLYGDPNKLSSSQVNMLVSEVGKIASGGVPSMHELEGLSPGTLSGAMSTAWGKLANHPNPANAAAFVKQYTDYTDQLAKDARDVIHDKYGRVLEGRKSTLEPSDYDVLNEKYINRFSEPEKPSTGPGLLAAGSQGQSPQPLSQLGLLGGSSSSHPQDSEAVQWAKANPRDPRSAAILKANGM